MNTDLSGRKINLQTGTSLFRSKHLSIVKTKLKGADGIGVDSNLKTAIKKSISENEERDNLYYKANLNKKTSVTTIFNKKVTFGQEMYYSLIYTGGSDFKDSSGVGAGQSSFKAIEHAFYEFIERQSMVYSFLMERPGKNLDFLVGKNEKLFEMIPKGAKYLIRDISIVANVSVVVVIICHNGKFAMGLGADKLQLSATQKAINEAVGYNGQMVEDHENTMSFMDFSRSKNFPPDSYSRYMTEQFSGQKLLETFNFFSKSTNARYWIKREKFSLHDMIESSSELNIPINIQFMPTYVDQNMVKVVYVNSPEAYQSINNISIDPDKYQITYFENLNPISSRVHAYLPFP